MNFSFTSPITQRYSDFEYQAFPTTAYKGEKTWTSSCAPSAKRPDIVVTRSAYSIISQADADDLALSKARDAAVALRAENPCPNLSSLNLQS